MAKVPKRKYTKRNKEFWAVKQPAIIAKKVGKPIDVVNPESGESTKMQAVQFSKTRKISKVTGKLLDNTVQAVEIVLNRPLRPSEIVSVYQNMKK